MHHTTQKHLNSNAGTDQKVT